MALAGSDVVSGGSMRQNGVTRVEIILAVVHYTEKQSVSLSNVNHIDIKFVHSQAE